MIFFGSSAFAVPSLLEIARAHDVVGVYTQADRPAGRGLKLTPTPVKTAAAAASMPVFTPEKLDAAFCEATRALLPDVLVTASYGKILPRTLLRVPALGALNVHPSLLPEYRGATPIQAALRDGLSATGVSIIWMNERMDAGDIALAQTVAIKPDDDFESLHDRLALVSAALLRSALHELAAGTLGRVAQDETKATFTRPIVKDDLRLAFDDASRSVNVVRSLSPKPGAWLELNGTRLKVLEARAEDGARATPGTVVSLDGDGPLIACRTGSLRLLRVVPAGKPPMSGADFARSMR
ncbi:MAG TPA: methionyl-tRNA formyltransferase [Magnetospirillaceae bacterium]|nr:methionyl-tRNA formyltransferase [Magnetospirillaceae bacterium]